MSMRHAGFWLFQILVLTGVIAVSSSLFSTSVASDAATPQKQGGYVLADSSDVFYQSAGSDLSVDALYNHINQQRTDAGLSGVVPNAELAQEARRRAVEMREDGFYAHAHPETGVVFSDSL